MIRSIRKFLLINLMLAVTLITAMAIIGNLFVEHKRFIHQLDAQLTLSAYTIESFLDIGATPEELKAMQARIDSIPQSINKINYGHDPNSNQGISALLNSIQFQVWNKDQRLILTSAKAKDIPLVISSENVGFDNVWRDKIPWRIFSVYNPTTGYHIVVMQPSTTRSNLEKQISQDALMVMSMIYPFLGLLIWVIVGRGLESIHRTTTEIKRRSNPNRLKPIKTKHLPIEIEPLVDELNSLFMRLEKAFLREKRFASDAAHELRTPLSGIAIHAELARDAQGEIERQEAFDMLKQSIDHCAHVISQLLILSRMVPETGLQEAKKIHIGQCLDDTIGQLDALIKKHQCDIHVNHTIKDAWILGNPTAIGIMLRNVLDNAMIYSPPSSLLNIIIRQHDQRYIAIDIIDQGPGIPPSMQNRIFERFYRGKNHTPGSGLGLGIVKQITDLHHGKIQLQNNANGHGLCFTIILPQHDA